MKRQIPIRILAVTFPIAALLLAWSATMVRLQRGDFPPAPWLGAATVGGVGYLIISSVYVLLLRTRIRGAIGERLRERGIDPVYFVGLAGMCILLCPAILATFLSFAGMDLLKLKVATAFSVVALLIWPWVYRGHQSEPKDSRRPAPPDDRA